MTPNVPAQSLEDLRALEAEAAQAYAEFEGHRTTWTKAGANIQDEKNWAPMEAARDRHELAAYRVEDIRMKLGLGVGMNRLPTPTGGPDSAGAAFRQALERMPDQRLQPVGSMGLPNMLESWLALPLSGRFAAAVESGTVRRTLQSAAPISLYPRRRRSVLEIVPMEEMPGKIGGDAIQFLRQTVYTPGATVVDAGGEKPDTVVTIANASTTLYKVATISEQVPSELFASFGETESWISGEMTRSVLEKCEYYALSGDGTGEPGGVAHASTGVATQAKGSDTPHDCIRRALATLEASDIEASGIVMHPSDWLDFDLEIDAAGRPLFGDPSQRTEPNLWGVPVFVTTAATAGTAIVGDWTTGAKRWSGMSMVQWTQAVASDAKNNYWRCIFETGFGFAVTRPGNFVLCTGL